MANFVFNVARGRLRQYYDSVDSNLVIATGPIQSTADSGLIIVLLEASGIEADNVLADYDNLSDLLSGASNEQTTMGRKTITDADISASAQNDTDDRLDLDIPDQTWLSASGNAVAKLLVCYDPDTGSGSDSAVVPLTAHDFSVTPSGTTVTAQVDASGFWRSA